MNRSSKGRLGVPVALNPVTHRVLGRLAAGLDLSGERYSDYCLDVLQDHGLVEQAGAKWIVSPTGHRYLATFESTS